MNPRQLSVISVLCGRPGRWVSEGFLARQTKLPKVRIELNKLLALEVVTTRITGHLIEWRIPQNQLKLALGLAKATMDTKKPQTP